MGSVGLKLTIEAQVKSGKNGIRIHPATGRHFPTPAFKAWRSEVEAQLRPQLARVPRVMYDRPLRGRPGSRERVPVVFAVPVVATIHYTPGDLFGRDVPGMEDALWHVLERLGVVGNDALIQTAHFIRQPLDREAPRCVLEFAPLEAQP